MLLQSFIIDWKMFMETIIVLVACAFNVFSHLMITVPHCKIVMGHDVYMA